MKNKFKHSQDGLYNPIFERDNCGFGLITQMDDTPSHWVIDTSIKALQRLTHRGAISDDGKTSDGCGLLIKKPDSFFRSIAKGMGIELGLNYAFGPVFLDESNQKKCMETIHFQLRKLGLNVEGWRSVPINKDACGKDALSSLPIIKQVVVTAPDKMIESEFEKKLYIARIQAEKILSDDTSFYMPSLSSRVISYKGLIISDHI